MVPISTLGDSGVKELSNKLQEAAGYSDFITAEGRSKARRAVECLRTPLSCCKITVNHCFKGLIAFIKR